MSIWVVDADQIQSYDYSSDILFLNDRVKEFLHDEKKLGIMSPKGFGKTFLLKSKRKLSQDAGNLCIPKDAMCDILDTVNIADENDRYMNDVKSWVSLWKYAISISVLKNCIENDEDKSIYLKSEKGDELTEELFEIDYLRTPCQIVNSCLLQSRKSLNIALSKQPMYLNRLSVLHTPIHIFIDKVDQALKDNIHLIAGYSKMSRGATNFSVWTFAQVGLMEAAYDILVHNPHIKIYFGIRSEAYMEAPSITDLALQLNSYVVTLEYSDDDLRAMFCKYVASEEDEYLQIPTEKKTNPEKSFFGFDQLPHGYVEQNEAPFKYLLRHTLKRPRDIMHICSALCNQELNVGSVRHIVNLQANLILQAYIREIGPFVFDKHENLWDEFWKKVNRNVFVIEYAKRICQQLNGVEDAHCKEGCKECSCFKPFSRLYETGLLGIIHNSNVQDTEIKIAMQPLGRTRIQDNKENLPTSEVYFLHPLVTNKIEMERRNIGYSFDVCKEIIVGDGYLISKKQVDLIKQKKKVFVSSTCDDRMEDIRKAIRDSLERRGYEPVLSEEPDFRKPGVDVHSYDHCLHEVLKCDSMISLIGFRYGGEYRLPSGNDSVLEFYKESQDFREELKKASGKNITPSISMMESYIARCNGIPVYTFADVKVYNERHSYIVNQCRDDFKPGFVQKTQVFDHITYITKQDSNNWFDQYDDLSDLIKRIEISFPIDPMHQLM